MKIIKRYRNLWVIKQNKSGRYAAFKKNKRNGEWCDTDNEPKEIIQINNYTYKHEKRII